MLARRHLILRSAVHVAFVVGVSAASCFVPPAVAGPNECPARGASNPDCGQHNMMLIGEQAIFASHLPMFKSEHRFQLILQIDLQKDKNSLSGAYVKDRKEHPDIGMYTLQPSEKFILARIFSAEKTRLQLFPGTVFRGHLERGGAAINQLTGIDIAVQRVVYAKEIGPPKGPNRANILEYIVFGKDDETFLAHRITQPPDFDQLLNVKISGGTLTEAQLKKGVLVTVPNRQNEPARRLKRGETVTARGRVTGEETVVSLEIMVVAEPYFEEGELATRFTMKPTPLEIEAGFRD